MTKLATQLLKADVALLSLVDTNRQFFKSSCGLPSPLSEDRQTPLSHSFCQHVVASSKPFIVDDASRHPLVASNLAVVEFGVAAYLGVPVHSPDGQTLGALCAIASEPRRWSKDDLGAMEDLAAIVDNELKLRETVRISAELAEHNAVLVSEYHHRVKNTLAVASSLVVLSGREAKSVQEAVSKAQGRLMALADAHDSLLAESDNVDLAELAARLVLPYSLSGAAAEVDGPGVLLRQNQITPVCLLLHELATNSAKYGAFKDGGQVGIRWTKDDAPRVTLVWDEHSQSIGPRQEAGFGSKLIGIAVGQLEGKLTRDWASGHLRVTLIFPLKP